MLRHIWIIFLFISTSLLADSRKELADLLAQTELSRSNLTAIFIRAEDQPRKFLEDLAELWNQTSSDTDSLLKARIGWMIGRFANYEEIPNFKVRKALQETLELIQKRSVPVSIHDLRYFIAFTAIIEEGQEKERNEQLLQLADRIENPDTRAFAYTQLLFDFVNAGSDSQSIPLLLTKVTTLLPMNTKAVSPIHVATLNELSSVLALMGQSSQAQKIDERLDATCQDQAMRAFCAIRSYNRGILLLKERLDSQSLKAIAQFEYSLQLSLSIEDWVMKAKNKYGLSRAYNILGQHEKSLVHGREATVFLEDQQMFDWAALALTQAAHAYLALNRPTEALAAAQKALELCPPHIGSIVTEIDLELSKSYEALGQSDRALLHHKRYAEGERKIRTDDAQKRYMQLRDESLSKQNELQFRQIELLKKFRLVSMLAAALAFILALAMLLTFRQSLMLRESRRRMKVVLDNIDEGIALLDRELRIQKGHSPFLHKLFGDDHQNLEGLPFLQLFKGGDEAWEHDIVVAREALQTCLGESMLSWDFNSEHLPREFRLHERTLALHWQPLLNQSGMIDRYLVAVRDITAFKDMERRALHEEHRVHLLQHKMLEIVGSRLPEVRKMIDSMSSRKADLLNDIRHESRRPESLRQLHTWKGMARTLRLKSMASSIHELESSVVHNHDIEESWQSFTKVLADYEYLLHAFNVSENPQSTQDLSLYQYIALYASDIRTRMAHHGCQFEGIWVLDQVLEWNQEQLPQVHQILLHLLSNAIDHGYIRPHQKGVLVRSARISIEATLREKTVLLEVKDNGAGIDWVKVREKALTLGMPVEDGQDLSAVLFHDGVSTAENTSETSGRGVGLSAVMSLCDDLSAQIRLGDVPGGGTQVQVEIPISIALKKDRGDPLLPAA